MCAAPSGASSKATPSYEGKYAPRPPPFASGVLLGQPSGSMAEFAEYTHHDAVGLADLIARREVSVREVVEAARERIALLNTRLSAVVSHMDEEAERLVTAHAAGPFAGVPFLLKDLGLLYAGHTLTNGSRFWRDFVPDHHSTLTERYLAAGLVVLGKTNTPELGLAAETASVALGACHNPWAPARSAGGSSGGAAAAVAARMVPMAHASDGGGSIRIPSANCGVFGLKPTRARNPIGPDVGEGWSGLATHHCISISVRDSAALLDATQGAAPGDPYWAPPPSRPFAEEVTRDPGMLRIGLIRQAPSGTPVDPACLAAVDEAARLCESLGHRVEEARFAIDWDALVEGLLTIVSCNTGHALELRAAARGRAARPDDVEAVTWQFAERGKRLGGTAYPAALLAMHTVGRQVADTFMHHDVILSPTLAEPPLPLNTLDMMSDDLDAYNERTMQAIPFTGIYNVSGCPAMSVPLIWSGDGLPIGIQFGASFGREDTLIRLAGQLERARPWARRVPPMAR